jgi:hypothetical protein
MSESDIGTRRATHHCKPFGETLPTQIIHELVMRLVYRSIQLDTHTALP